MKKTIFCPLKSSLIIIFLLNVTGCASYRYELTSDQYQGYVVKRNEFLIPEYTTDSKNKAPADLTVAKERFKRRHSIVDDYYKKMGVIENQFKALVVNYPLALVTLVSAVVRLPFILVSDFRYNNNPKYRKRVDKRDAEIDRKEKEAREKLRKQLEKFIEEDTAKENPAQAKIPPG